MDRFGDFRMGKRRFWAAAALAGSLAALLALFAVPDDLELMAVYRLGYLPHDQKRPSIDWSSRHRKRLSQFVARERWGEPEEDGED